MKEVNKDQIKKIHSILPDVYRNDKDMKAQLVVQFTEDESKTSTKDLTFYQAEELIHFLETGKVKDFGYYGKFDLYNTQHKYLLSLCHQIGWETYSEQLRKLVVDLSAFGSWLRKYGYLHKTLKEYSTSELPKLVTQFENLVRSKSKKAAV